MTKDPVCGMRVGEHEAQETSELDGKTYYFCSVECKLEFDEEPQRYLHPMKRRAA
jgi:YHS domain-containing protein